ncbi:asparagine synthase (glutamine-hydrolyzing) [Mucilaginibacter sp. BJC16-A38]|uniref:asparagine synthase (glutamine-hydrolyzing) n=1 Tax=Mucilaginibacter phenanthrenivorans TaxID=1234842 RepID=UPI002157802E|nr:asparagine synthase (glutamine-hydrolyzing) [Mucilaginibacter phenanthrenivorans]MCR8560201.1 asparagine synthase (glutamine-hydrolyzing) [Mucilaginibacter phenanthrenivorans]
MCRIAGIISAKYQASEREAKTGRMCATLAHGGPDDEGLFSDAENHITLGHRRLSVIDLSRNGHQPMSDNRKRAWISFNGEIYNYAELKRELAGAGLTFHSDTDTEVIITGYLHWGTGVFSRLRGMFAFALYDVEKSLTFLVRDSAGIKPLYYYAQDGTLIFSSEVKTLKITGMVTEADETWPVRFLALGHIPEPYTTLKNVFSIEKGHFLVWDNRAGSFRIQSFAGETAVKTDITSLASAREHIRDALQIAVQRQLMADAPIGVFLSGGIDSSLISLLANKEKHQLLKTISIYFNERSYDERSYQNIVLNELEGEKFAHLVRQEDFDRLFPAIVSSMDMPTTDGINTWFISKYAHEDGLKAVLSGVGADELFGGYPSFNRISYLGYLRSMPSKLFKLARYLNADKYKKISFLAHDHPLADYLLLRGLFTPDDIAEILDIDEDEVNRILFGENLIPDLGPYNQQHAAWFETNIYMQNQLLRDTDVMSMHHGLEVRVPFLDEDFRQLVGRIDPAIRFSKKQPKKLLIESFGGLLPEAVWNRPKMGFTFPLQEWMGKHIEISDEVLYRGRIAKDTVKKFKQGRLHWSKVFALYQIQLHD